LRKNRLALAALAVFLFSCYRNPVTNRREAKVISEAAEKEIGAETRDQLVQEYGEMKDPVLREYVSALGNKLAAVSDRPNLPFTFTVMDSGQVNAFAAPGGYIFVTRGMLEELQNEAELAVVLGHEIAHVCAWHSINMIEKQMGYGALTTLGAIASGISAGPEAMIMVAQTASLFTNIYLSGYSREHELEADRVGLRYAISAGYRPQAALAFFQRLHALEKKEGLDKWDSFFRTHPQTTDRINLAKRYMDNMNPKRPFIEGVEVFEAMQDRLPHLSPEEKGRTEGLIFHHDKWGLSVTIPSDWKWEPTRRQALAVFREAKGLAWGELRRQPLADGKTARDYAEKIASERQWTFMQGREVLYPAGYGFLGQYYGTGVLGGLYQYRAFFVVQNNVGYALFCAAPPEDIIKYYIPFEQVLRSFRIG